MPGIKGLCNSGSMSYCGSWVGLNEPFRLFGISSETRRICTRKHLISCSKTLDYQDFQGYARPLRLLPVTEPNIFTQTSAEEMSTSLEGDSQSVYVLKLSTSNMFGSGLSDLGSGILLCLIDENSDSILQRISATSVGTRKEGDLQEICFQRGSVDEFIFKGPKLERIKALWVGLESGRWRLGGVSLTTIHGRQDQSEDESDNGLHYAFRSEDIPIGDGEDTSIIELKPTHITEGLGLLNLSTTTQSNANTLLNLELSNQESMKEYADLKSSLLLYDSLLIFAGTSISTIFSGEKAGLAFLTGGALGFLYLLLLQKSVDGLPSSVSLTTNVEEDNVFDHVLKQLKNPVTSLALAVAVAGVAVKYGSGDVPIELTAQEILVGMTGFLVCKVAVLLAAFKPMEEKI